MLTLFWTLFATVLAALAVAAGLSVHFRRRQLLASTRPSLDDEAIDTIVATGRLVVDEEESLDLDDIDEEEDRFWSESWDEPEEW